MDLSTLILPEQGERYPTLQDPDTMYQLYDIVNSSELRNLNDSKFPMKIDGDSVIDKKITGDTTDFVYTKNGKLEYLIRISPSGTQVYVATGALANDGTHYKYDWITAQEVNEKYASYRDKSVHDKAKVNMRTRIGGRRRSKNRPTRRHRRRQNKKQSRRR